MRIPGVGFRFFTRHRAVEYNLTGWVRNTDNNKVCGSVSSRHRGHHESTMPSSSPSAERSPRLTFFPCQVEGEVQGEEDAIASFLKRVDKGPRHAHVVRLDKEDREVVDGEDSFEIRR